MKISLIIATYNRPDALELVLLSVARQLTCSYLTATEIEVLVADDGSTLATAQLLAKYAAHFPFSLIHVWHEDKGFRLAAIRNLAVSKSRGRYLIFIDGDCLIAEDYLLQQYQLAEPGYFVGGNRVLLNQSYTQRLISKKSLAIASTSIWVSLVNRLLGRTNKWLAALRLNPGAQWRKSQLDNWQRPKGCNMALWRADFLLVNGFDESFMGWGHEDADFLVRLLHAGIKIKDGRFAAPVYHLWHKINERNNEVVNKQRLNERINNQTIIKAPSGVNKYLN